METGDTGEPGEAGTGKNAEAGARETGQPAGCCLPELRPESSGPEPGLGAAVDAPRPDLPLSDLPVVLPVVGRLRRRQDFLAANRGARVVMPAFILLVHGRADGSAEMRAGFTVSKRVGNAVTRNRAKRRLREVVRATLGAYGTPGADHVFIARPQEKERAFSLLLGDMEQALRESRERPPRGARGGPHRRRKPAKPAGSPS